MINFSAPAPIAELWRLARAFLADTLDAFGGPRKIQSTFDRIARRAIKRQLKAFETVLLKLLLIEAAGLAPSVAASHRARVTGQGRAACIDPARPETWRVSLHLHIPPEPENTIAPRIRSLGPSRFVSAVVVDAKTYAKRLAFLAAMRATRDAEACAQARAEKLARRFEALRRVFANPKPSARRLKRKLMALTREAFAAATRIASAKPPRGQLDPLFSERTQYAARQATPAFAVFNSS